MALAWTRPRLESPVETPAWEAVAPARVAPERPWVLYVGTGEEALRGAACARLREHGGLPVIAPPETPSLPVAVHRLSPPSIDGERLLFVHRVDASFLDGPFSAGSPLYLLPKLAQVASGGAPLGIIATALEPRAGDLIAQRGLWSRFEIRRVEGEGPSSSSPPMSPDEALAPEPGSGLSLLFETRGRKPPEAVPLLKRAVALEPEIAAAHYELGKALIATDDLEGAIAAFRRTTELLPEYASAWGNLGAALGEAQRLDESTEALTRAVALDPLSHALHSNLGVALRDQGRLEEARAHLEKAVAIAPGFVFGHYNLASVSFLAGRYDDAIASFERGRELDASRSPRQSLLLAVTRLASGDVAGALDEYRELFTRLDDDQTKRDMRTVAEWDLKQLASRLGVSDPLREAAKLLKTLA